MKYGAHIRMNDLVWTWQHFLLQAMLTTKNAADTAANKCWDLIWVKL
jgi:hypothetical protein